MKVWFIIGKVMKEDCIEESGKCINIIFIPIRGGRDGIKGGIEIED